jgi:GNAT superfamily N-acetyltransferase
VTHAPIGYRIEAARPDAVAALPAIELAAAARFSDQDIAPELRSHGLSSSFFAQAARAGRVFVALEEDSGDPVGFALATRVDGSAHLYEMDVLPEHGGRGLGRALVSAVAAWARSNGYATLTLTTFRHLPWNAPFYRKMGFEELDALACSPELADCLRAEAEHGLDPRKRVAMRLYLSAPSRPVSAEVQREVKAPIEKVFDVFAPIDLTRIMLGFGPMPAVSAVEDQIGGWDAPGQSRTIRLADDSTMRETLTRVEPPGHFAYRIDELTSPLRHLTPRFRGAWWFVRVGPERTLARWRYEFEPRSALARPLTALVVKGLWRPYMARALELATEQAENGDLGR